jgi:hypothetical protein
MTPADLGHSVARVAAVRLSVTLVLAAAVAAFAWLAPAARAAPTQLGSGEHPAIAVDGTGMAHVVWNESVPGGVDVLHYCRIPSGHTACSDEQTFTPLAPQPSYDDAGPEVMLGASGEVILLTHRVGVVVEGQFASLLYVSDQGGAPGSFSGPTPVGNEVPGGRPALFDAGERIVVTISAARTGGTFVQGAPIGRGAFSTAEAQLSSGDKAYEGTVVQRGPGSYTAAYADFNNVYLRTFDCSGTGCTAHGINDAANWGHEITVTGAQEPRLASGPGGTFLMSRDRATSQWMVRKVIGSDVGSPHPISATGAGEFQRDLFEDQAGRLHAVFLDANGSLTHRSSEDGTTWSDATVLEPGPNASIADLRVAAANRAGGFDGLAVWAAGAGNVSILLARLRPTPSRLAAALTTPSRARALGLTVLDASSSAGASRFRWDLNGDGRDDVECGGSQPVLGVRLLRAGTTTVRLTAVAADGRTAVARENMHFIGKALPQRDRSKIVQVSVCAQQAARNAFTGLCTTQLGVTAHFGVIEARGCLKRATRLSDIPGPDRVVLDEAVDQFRRNPPLNHYVNLAVCGRVLNCPSDPLQGGRRASVVLNASDLLVSSGPVQVNGLTFVPKHGASIVLYPQIGRIVSSNAVIALGAITVRSAGKLNLDVGSTASFLAGRVNLDGLSFDARALGKIGGFLPHGRASLTLVHFPPGYYTQATLSLQLPDAFGFGGEPPSGTVRVRADNNSGGLVLDELHLGPISANLGGMQFDDLRFNYSRSGNTSPDPQFNCPRKWWQAQGRAFWSATGTGLDLAPFPPKGIAFCNGSFRSFAMDFRFGTVAPQIFPGVFLDAINFRFGLDPTIVSGGASISALELVSIDPGTLLSVFASSGAPYRFDEGADSPLHALDGTLVQSTTFALGGKVGLRLPFVGTLPLASGYFMYSAGNPPLVKLGGDMGLKLPGFTLGGEANGVIGPAGGKEAFSFSGRMGVEIAGLGRLGADASVTSKGVVACGDLVGLHPGAGYHWGDTWPTIWLVDGCKPSRYWVTFDSRAARTGAAAARALTFTVARGERSKNVALPGASGAPRVEVRAPDGETISTAGGDFVTGRRLALLRQDAGKVTWIGVHDATPGTYTVTPLAGSPPISRLAATRPGGVPHIKAYVAGTGRRRTLRYDAAFDSSTQIALFERADAGVFRRLGFARRGHGEIAFAPTVGPSGRRQIVAQAVVGGIPAPTSIVTSFRAPAAPRAGRPTRLRLRRHGKLIKVSWRRVTNAAAYRIVLEQRNGLQRQLRLPARSHDARFGGIPLDQRGTVTVRALGPLGDWSRPARAAFRLVRRARSRLLPFSELGHHHRSAAPRPTHR